MRMKFERSVQLRGIRIVKTLPINLA